ncbi:hypothetical protein BH09ACT13_BH09ACT13_06210 [soil metagenome]
MLRLLELILKRRSARVRGLLAYRLLHSVVAADDERVRRR